MDPVITTLGIPTGVAGWNILQSKTASDFPALSNDPVVKREIAYFEQKAPKATTAQALLSDPRLQDFVLTAFGMSSESGMTALLQKVLNSKPGDSNSLAAQMADARFTQFANAFNYGGPYTPAKPPTASSAEVAVNGLFQQSTFGTFSGTFGGLTISNVDVSGATTYQGLADALQSAFRRADGNRTDISVKFDGTGLHFTDAQGRGTATAFAWTINAANTGAAPTAAAASNLVSGAAATPAVGGPSVTDPAFIQQVVQKYTEAQFENVIGNTSNALKEARYAQQQLPHVTNWYSVIADRPLADVIQTVLGLPSSFGALDVDQQARVLSQRMNIKDFQSPAKLSKLLTQFMAMSDMQTQNSANSAAVQMLNGASSTKMITLTLPDTFSSASAGAMILSTSMG